MASPDNTLKQLEGLLNEFYDGVTGNERKKQIEIILSNFAIQENVWKDSLYFLHNTQNQYAHMFLFGVLENIVNQKWQSVPYEDKQQIRKFLLNFISTFHKQLPTYIRNKALKVFVDVGRVDWPMFYPSFFSNIVQLLRNSDTAVIGVLGLQMISEEFVSPLEDLSMTRKKELKECLLQHVPDALNMLVEILNAILLKQRQLNVGETPPPSPNQHSPYHTPFQSPYQSPCASPHSSPAHNAISPNSTHQKIASSLSINSLDAETKELCIAIFSCIAHYVAWQPFTKVVTPTLLVKLFNFIEYGCVRAPVQSSSNNIQVGIAAINCANEILSKRFIPTEYDSFILVIYQNTMHILQRLVSTVSNDASLINESYLEKVSGFLLTFVETHLHKCESKDHFPTAGLLLSILNFTNVQTSPDIYLSCIEVWDVILDYFIDKVSSCITVNFKVAALEKYVNILKQLFEEVLHKVQYQHNNAMLHGMDRHDIDEADNKTEWEKFLIPCLEVLGSIAELLPDESIAQSMQLMEETLQSYFDLEAIVNVNSKLYMNFEQFFVNGKSHSKLLDAGTIFRLLGHLSTLFTDEIHFKSRFQQGQALLSRLLHGVMFGVFYKPYNLPIADKDLLLDFIDLNCQAIGSIHAYSHWLYKWNINQQELGEESFKTTISSILDIVVTIFKHEAPHKIYLSTSHLLESVTAAIRPTFFLTTPQAQELYGNCPALFSNKPKDVQRIVFKALSNGLVLPWPSISDSNQNWQERSMNHQNFIKSICPSLKNVDSSMLADSHRKEKLSTELFVLSDIMEAVSHEKTPSRKIVYNSIRDYIDLCKNILSLPSSDADLTDTVLAFLVTATKSMKLQMGHQSVEDILLKLLSVLSREHILSILNENSKTGLKVLRRLTDLFIYILQEPEASFKRFHPHILSYCLEHLLPVLKEFDASEEMVEVLEVFYQAMLNNWRYFFKSDVISKMNGEDQLQHEEQFAAIMNEFGGALLNSSIALFKKSIDILSSLNEKFHLYQKVIFQSSMLSSFLQVLLTCLIEKSQSLYTEDILQTIFNMVSNNIQIYHSQYAPSFIASISGLTDRQKSQLHEGYKFSQDMPSFCTGLEELVGEIRYMQILNSNLR